MLRPVILLVTLPLFFHSVLCQKIQVEVLFESLCPDSYRFITQQLYPNWKDVSPHVDLKLVPFGKSKSFQNGQRFQCQHGPRECQGNRIMSCVLNHLPNQDLHVEYTNCFMSKFKRENNQNSLSDTCATSLGVNPQSLLQCTVSDEGILYQLEAEKVTAKYRPGFVPTIIYNGQQSPKLQAQSLVDFKGAVCSVLLKTYGQIVDVCSTSFSL